MQKDRVISEMEKALSWQKSEFFYFVEIFLFSHFMGIDCKFWLGGFQMEGEYILGISFLFFLM